MSKTTATTTHPMSRKRKMIFDHGHPTPLPFPEEKEVRMHLTTNAYLANEKISANAPLISSLLQRRTEFVGTISFCKESGSPSSSAPLRKRMVPFSVLVPTYMYT